MTVDCLCVISLDRALERYAALLRRVPDLPVERFAAVDGQTLDRARLIADGLIAEDILYEAAVPGWHVRYAPPPEFPRSTRV